MNLNIGLILFAILALAVFLRFFRLKQRGILVSDDGLRMREVLFCSDLYYFLKNNLKRVLARQISFKENAEKFRGRFLYENPLNIFLYCKTSLITKNLEYSALLTNGIFAILGILGVFMTSLAMFDARIGLISAFLLTISGYHLMYSRSIHAEITSGTFLVWATYFYWLSCSVTPTENKTFIFLLVSGILAGSAFCANARQFHIPPLFIGFELVWQIFFDGTFFAPRMIILCVGLLIPFLVIEQFLVLLKEMGYPYWTFSKLIYERMGHLSKPNYRFPSAWNYLKTIVQCEGPLVPLLAIVGMVWLLSKDRFVGIILASQTLLPLLLWSLRPTKEQDVRKGSMGSYQFPVPRLISGFCYGAVILCSVELFLLPQAVFYPILLVIGGYSFFVIRNLLNIRSGYKKAIEFITQQGDGKHFTNISEISSFYVGNDKAVNIYEMNKETAEKLYKQNQVRYLLFVPSIHYNTCRSMVVDPFDAVVAKTKPIFTTEVGIGQFKPILVDDYNNLSPKIFEPNLICIYDLKDFYLN